MSDARLSIALRRRVRHRSGQRCEYCRIPVQADGLPSHVDHVVPRKHGGRTTMSNLAHGCAWCNLHKGTDIAGFDRSGGRLVPLFNPRRQLWTRHFRYAGPILIGRTAVGRVTVRLLRINDHRRAELRRLLMVEGLF